MVRMEKSNYEALIWFAWSLWGLMLGVGFSLIIVASISAVPIIVNATDTLGNNYTLTIDLPQINNTYISNYTINQTINQTVIYNITNVNMTCINCTYINTNMTANGSYTKNESDSIYVLKTDLQNWKTVELPSNYLKKADINYSDIMDSVSKIKNNFTDINTRLDDNSFTSMWKIIMVITIILCLIAIGMAVRAMIG